MATSVTKRSRGKQCSVYGCFNFAFLQNGVPSGIHLFHIPKAVLSDKHKRDRWCSLIKRHDGRDGFSLNNNTVVCQNHFRSEDITISLARKRWSLKPDVEPTVFDWANLKSKRKSPKKRLPFELMTPTNTDSGDDHDVQSETLYWCEPIKDDEVMIIILSFFFKFYFNHFKYN